MIHSLFLCNGDGIVLFKRYYSVVPDKLNWENQLFLSTSKRWPHARNEIHQCLQINKRNIVFTFWGEILVTIVGEEEYDELTLSDTLDILGEYVKEVTKRQLNELNEQHIDYEKLCIGFDEMISSTGILDQTDVSKVGTNYKIKTVWIKSRGNLSEKKVESKPIPPDESYLKVCEYLKRNGYSDAFAGQRND